jgi:hypothetical protein
VKLRKFILALGIITAAILLQNCDDQIVENDLGYNEKAVVRGLLEAGKPVKVYLGKTYPPNTTFTKEDGYLTDAEAFIINRGNQHPLEYQGEGIYSAGDEVVAVNGQEYELNFIWKGDTIKSKTHVPFSTTFQQARLIKEFDPDSNVTYHLEGFLVPRENAVYGATWMVIDQEDTLTIESEVIPNILREQDQNLDGLLLLRTENIPEELVENYRNSLFIRVHAFDEVFYNYFITQDANNASTNIFSQSGINLRWNVEGNAIGLFLGKSDFVIKVQ